MREMEIRGDGREVLKFRPLATGKHEGTLKYTSREGYVGLVGLCTLCKEYCVT